MSTPTSTMAPERYLDHIRRESQRFRDVLADCDPAARVPGCPDWDAADLLFHLAGVQHFWSTIIRQRPVGPEELADPERPASYAELLAFFDTSSAALVTALEEADPAEHAWSWAPEQTVGFTYRRQAHEALIHRLDAEQAAGQETPLDATLSADGVLETLDVMFGGTPSWGAFTPGEGLVRVDIADTGDSVLARLGIFSGTDPDSGKTYADEEDLNVVPDDGTEPDVVVTGDAAALNAWLWRRRDDSGITVAGDETVYTRFRGIVNNPLN